MYDFKKFRKDKGWTQEVAADIVFGMSAKFWRKLEQHDKPEKQLIAYGKACDLYDSGFRHVTFSGDELNNGIKEFCLDYNTSVYELGDMTGHGRDIIYSLMTGKAQWSKRWKSIVNAVCMTIREEVEAEQKAQVDDPDEFCLDDFDVSPLEQVEQADDPIDQVISILLELKLKNVKMDQLLLKIDLQEQRITALENANKTSKPEEPHESISAMKAWVHDSAKDIVHELLTRGSLDSKAKMFNNFWADHNSYVGVSMFADVKTQAQAERSMKFTENRARVLAVPLRPFQTTINLQETVDG